MNIAVISDIHDNIWNLDKALKIIEKRNIKTAIFCGDYCAPTTFKLIVGRFSKTYCIWGNVDGEKYAIMKFLMDERIENIEMLGDFGEIEIDNLKVAVIHKPEIAKGLAHSGLYDAVFHGHNHTASKEMVGKTLLANPGEVMGSDGKPSFGIWDTKKNDIEIIRIPT